MTDGHNTRIEKIRIDDQAFDAPNDAPTGRQLLALVGKSPDEFYLTLTVEGAPDITVETDEPFDITVAGIEQFNLVSKRRYFSIRINEGSHRVPSQFPTGHELLALVGKSSETHLLSLSLTGPDEIGPDDELIDADQKIDLGQPGREQFFVIKRKPITITIDEAKYTPSKSQMLGAELRQLAVPPVASNRDLWLDVSGRDDQKVLDTTSIKLKDGLMFYTSPGKINPGA